MTLVDQWQAIESGLASGWGDALLALAIDDESRADRAAALLGPLQPGRLSAEVRFSVARTGAAPGPDALRRLLRGLDAEGIAGTLTLLESAEAAAPPPPTTRPSLAETWDAALGTLPGDWSDLYCEVELTSSDHLDPGALALAPLNPARYGSTPGFRFRVARSFGYGASPGMARRCLARLDERGIAGEVRVLRVLSDTRPAGTQGPVWYLDGKVV